MRYLELDEVLLIHERVLVKFGGASGLRDWGFLDSAVSRPRATFEGRDLYPDLFLKAAALAHSLLLNQPFVDGNKRTAWAAMRTMMEENGCFLRVHDDEIVELMIQIGDEHLDVPTIAAWLAKRATRVA